MFAHWGTFTKNYNTRTCLSIAYGAVIHQGYKVYNPDWSHEYAIFCGKGNVTMQVTCVPLNANQTYMIVSAYSDDSSAAELARNSVRKEIVQTVRIDDGPVLKPVPD